MTRLFRSPENLTCLSVLGLFLAVSSPVLGQESGNSVSKEYYVSADAGPNGDGSRQRPFLLLSQAESTSAAGDTIYLLFSQSGKVLDGGISLNLQSVPASGCVQRCWSSTAILLGRRATVSHSTIVAVRAVIQL